MATIEARAARNQEARERLDAVLRSISARLNVELPPPARRMQDIDLQPIVELERFAATLETVEQALAAQEEPSKTPGTSTARRATA